MPASPGSLTGRTDATSKPVDFRSVATAALVSSRRFSWSGDLDAVAARAPSVVGRDPGRRKRRRCDAADEAGEANDADEADEAGEAGEANEADDADEADEADEADDADEAASSGGR
jgi:hypothetical protein